MRTGWDPDEPELSPAGVSGSDFGQLFASQLDGQIYAQPVIADGTVFAATETDQIYGLDPITGAVEWHRDVGPAWPASAIGCGDLVPTIGITGTPVADPSTGTVYFAAKVDDGVDVHHPHWYLHAVDITTGAERQGFPTTIRGVPANDPRNPFNPETAGQRAGLLLLDGVVYVGFASHCDKSPYVGYVAGVDALTGRPTTLWSAEAGSATDGAGIWQSGGGLVSDGSSIFLATGNGVSPPPGPGTSAPANLAESVVRLAVGPDGNLTAADYFSPSDNINLDGNDTDFGSGGPMGLPDPFGTPSHPHLLVQVGKDGRVFLLDRDHLGGTAQGPNGTDDVVQTVGPYHGVWGHPALWGGDGGYVYTIENAGPLRAFALGVSGTGSPLLTSRGTSSGSWGYTSGSPVVTSDATASGSALVWAVWTPGPTGEGAELRAYDAVPSGGVLAERFAAPIGTAAKFETPATDDGHVYLGGRDGVLYAFGRPATTTLTAAPTDFGYTPVDTSAGATVTVTATRSATINAITTSAPFSVGTVSLPTTLQPGQTLDVPVAFHPTDPTVVSGVLQLRTDVGDVGFDLHGTGVTPGLSADPETVDFGDVPVGATAGRSVTITNTGTSNATITSTTAPSGAFSESGLPLAGTVIPPRASLAVQVTFAPTAAGAAASTMTVTADTGSVQVPMAATGVTGASRLLVSASTLDFGVVPVGGSTARSFTVANTGNLALTITKAAPPTAPFVTGSPIAEGQRLAPGDGLTETLRFAPTRAGPFTGTYSITADDGQGAQQVSLTGTAVLGRDPAALPAPAEDSWTANGAAKLLPDGVELTPNLTNVAGSAVYDTAVSPRHLRIRFTVRIGGGRRGDGLALGLLDATRLTSRALGRTGAGLGLTPLRGIGVRLDTYKNSGDPSANFEALTNTTADGTAVLAQRTLPTGLRTGTHAVDVTTAAGSVSVSIDGGPKLTASVVPPPTALIAFTAATGDGSDAHTVSDVRISDTAPASITAAGGNCMDVRRGQTADKTPVQFYPCNGTASQVWTPTPAGAVQALGHCLRVQGARTAPGTPVVLSACAGTRAERWRELAGGELWNPNAGRCVGSSTGGSASGTALALVDCTGAPTQTWGLGSVRAMPVRTTLTGAVRGAGAGCLAVRGDSRTDGTPGEIDACNGSAAQSWTLAGDGSVRALGKCLDITRRRPLNGSPVQIRTCAGTSTQHWVRLTDGELLNAGTRRCLATPGDVAADGTALMIGLCSASTGRRWAFPR